MNTEDHFWRAKAIKNLTIFCTLREICHCYAIHQRGLLLNTKNEELFLIKVNSLEDELLEVESENSNPKRLEYITLKYEPLKCIFCLS